MCLCLKIQADNMSRLGLYSVKLTTMSMISEVDCANTRKAQSYSQHHILNYHRCPLP
jgi:hypothetical protein